MQDLIRHISDPEHPLTLEQLRVVSAEQVELSSSSIMVEFTPTVPHCGMSTIIGKWHGIYIDIELVHCDDDRSLYSGTIDEKSASSIQGGYASETWITSERERWYVSMTHKIRHSLSHRPRPSQ